MTRTTRAALTFAVLAAGMVAPAMAYVGPGAGISLLGALWGVIVAVVLAIGMVLVWPVRIMLRKRKAAQAAAEDDAAAPDAVADSDSARTGSTND